MPFIDEKIEEDLVKEFAKICNVKPEAVELSISDRLDMQSISLKCHTQSKEETQDTELTIEMIDRTKFKFKGKIVTTSVAPKTRDIDQEWVGNPQTLVIGVRKVLAQAKIKSNKGIFGRYWGG